MDATNQNQQSSGVSGSWDAPVNVAYPHPSGNPDLPGPVVQFPDETTANNHAASVWDQLKSTVAPVVSTWNREFQSANDALANLPRALASSVTQPVTDEERATLGISKNPSFLEHTALAIARAGGFEQMATAAQWYKQAAQGKVPNAYEQALSVAPEAVGSAAPMPVLGRLLEGPQSKFVPATETSARPVARPTTPVESVPTAPLTEDQLAQEFIAKHFPDAKAEIKSGELGNVEPKPISAEELDRTLRATLRRQRATAAGQPVIEGEAHEPGTVSVNPAEAQAAAREFLKRVPKPEGIELEGSEGAAEESHAAKISGEASQGRGGKPRSQVLVEDENATVTAFLNRLEQQKDLLKSERGELRVPLLVLTNLMLPPSIPRLRRSLMRRFPTMHQVSRFFRR